MRICLWKVAVGMALFGFVATLEVSAAVAKEPTAITDQTKSFEGVDRDAAHETAMKWIDDLNQHGPLRAQGSANIRKAKPSSLRAIPAMVCFTSEKAVARSP